MNNFKDSKYHVRDSRHISEIYEYPIKYESQSSKIFESLSQAREKYQSLIPDFIFNALVDADKTPTKKLVLKMCELTYAGYNYLHIIHVVSE